MISTKPYLVRAIFDWCVDQGLTPYVTVAVDTRTRVPREYVKDGQIVLNISPEAANQLQIGNEEITFQARFGGVAFPVVVPMDAVAAIYARENGHGMAFEVVRADEEQPAAADESGDLETQPSQHAGGRPHLTRVK